VRVIITANTGVAVVCWFQSKKLTYVTPG